MDAKRLDQLLQQLASVIEDCDGIAVCEPNSTSIRKSAQGTAWPTRCRGPPLAKIHRKVAPIEVDETISNYPAAGEFWPLARLSWDEMKLTPSQAEELVSNIFA